MGRQKAEVVSPCGLASGLQRRIGGARKQASSLVLRRMNRAVIAIRGSSSLGKRGTFHSRFRYFGIMGGLTTCRGLLLGAASSLHSDAQWPGRAVEETRLARAG